VARTRTHAACRCARRWQLRVCAAFRRGSAVKREADSAARFPSRACIACCRIAPPLARRAGRLHALDEGRGRAPRHCQPLLQRRAHTHARTLAHTPHTHTRHAAFAGAHAARHLAPVPPPPPSLYTRAADLAHTPSTTPSGVPGDFVLLSLDAAKVGAEVQYEAAAPVGDTPPPEGAPLFPHLVRTRLPSARRTAARRARGRENAPISLTRSCGLFSCTSHVLSSDAAPRCPAVRPHFGERCDGGDVCGPHALGHVPGLPVGRVRDSQSC
jgi:hypothetical protein